MRVEVASWAVRPNEPSGFRGRKAILNHASAGIGLGLSVICQLISEDIKQHYLPSHHITSFESVHVKTGIYVQILKR